MRIASFDHFNVSPMKIVALGLFVSSGSGAILAWSLGGALGEATAPATLVLVSLVFYILASTPRRLLDRQRLSQARESLVLSAAAKACLSVTSSRSKTLIMLRPRDLALGEATTEGARRVLLGTPVDEATRDSSERLASYSAAEALRGIATLKGADFASGDEETRGLVASSELYRETKLPMFMTVCFFSQILVVLYAVFSHSLEPAKLV